MESTTKLSRGGKKRFQEMIYAHYERFQRKLPWRMTDDPYAIVVSEIMLQQTQVNRVIDKYHEFLEAFPTVRFLARVPLREVLRIWQGLGYNRRALSLKKLAEVIVADYESEIPSDVHQLVKLPGIGPATAHSICVFAFNRPVVFIETNIRAVFIHHFFNDRDEVRDSEIRPLVEQTLDRDNPRRWYNALMDYGVALKKQFTNPGKKSAHYHKQPPFEGSNRQVRGAVLKTLMKQRHFTQAELIDALPYDATVIKMNIKQLVKEELVVKKGTYISIP